MVKKKKKSKVCLLHLEPEYNKQPEAPPPLAVTLLRLISGKWRLTRLKKLMSGMLISVSFLIQFSFINQWRHVRYMRSDINMLLTEASC